MFWERLQTLCNKNGTSATEIMKKLGLSTSKITAWKNGSVPNGKILSELADFFDVSVDYLLGRDFTVTKNKVYGKYIIGYVDILGIKNEIISNPNKLKKTMDEIYDAFNKMDIMIKSNYEAFKVHSMLRRGFSDNIVFAIECDPSIDDNNTVGHKFVALAQSLMSFQYALINGKNSGNLFLRGAICFGELHFAKDYVIGPGLLTAYDMESHQAVVPRIIVAKDIIKKLNNGLLYLEQNYNRDIIFDKFEQDRKYYLNYLTYAKTPEANVDNPLKSHYDAISANENKAKKIPDSSKKEKALSKIAWVKYYHNNFCITNGNNKYIFNDVNINDFISCLNPTQTKNAHAEPVSANLTDGEKNIVELYHHISRRDQDIINNVLKFMASSTQTEDDNIIQFKCYDMPVSAGAGQYFNDYNQSYEIVKLQQAPPSKAEYIVRVSGDSMSPTYEEGDKLFIQPTETIDIGEIGIFVVNSDVYVKELGVNELISHNPTYQNIKLHDDDFVRCLGRVVGICDKFC